MATVAWHTMIQTASELDVFSPPAGCFGTDTPPARDQRHSISSRLHVALIKMLVRLAAIPLGGMSIRSQIPSIIGCTQ